jgi:alpha-glucosidase
LNRRALALRRELQTGEELEWVTNQPDVLHCKRKRGWEVVMDLNGDSVEVTKGELLVASAKLEGGRVPRNVTVWLRSYGARV